MNQPMTPDEEYEFYARPETTNPKGRAAAGSQLLCPFASHRNFWSKSGPLPPQTTALSRPGFAAQSSMSFATLPRYLGGFRGRRESTAEGSRP